MDAILSLVKAIVATIIGALIVVGSLFTGAVATKPILQPLATTNAPATTTAAQVATTTKVSSQQSSTKPKPAEQKLPISGEINTTPTPATGTSVQPVTPSPPLSIEELNQLARASVVNILCTTAGGGSFNPISGSGVIIDSRGIILTNAHVAQYFLLRNYPVANNIQCVVRTGSPAQPRYTAELMYLPPVWVDANAAKISSSSPSSTGQNDYAFLRITGTTNPNGTLPSSFPALPMVGADPAEGELMVLAAYPAGFLGGISIAINLYQTSAVATVGQVYAFSGERVDLFSLGGTVVSQAGSSGGAAVNGRGKLQGIIVTEVPAATTGGRDLRALTVGHINRSLAALGMGGITELLSGDPASIEANFTTTVAPNEIKELENALKQ